MATIRDVVDALGRREGVEAVILLGHDGLPIASHLSDGVDAEVLSALVPNVVQATEQLGHHAGRGNMSVGVVEFASGLCILSNLSADAVLLVMMKPRSNAGPLLYDLTRHRAEIAGLL